MPATTPDASRRALLKGAVLAPAAALLAACSSSEESSSAPSPGQSTAGQTPTTASTSASASASASSSASTGLELKPTGAQPFVTGLAVPWEIVFLPGGDALVSQRDTGAVVRVTPQGRTSTVGEVPGVVSSVTEGGEGGLLGLALHPGFPSTPYLYAYRTAESGNEVVRMRFSGGRLGDPRVVLDGIEKSLHHNGGGLVFGPDGHLFVSTGDAEDKPNAQDTSSRNGKILRVDADGKVPSDNPFDNAVWTTGHRNVEGLAFDETGQLWASEFGDKAEDELNMVVRGGNYGWPDVEGGDGPGGYRDPLATWPTDDCSPSGIAIAHGRAWLGALQGECVFSVVLRGSQRGTVQRHFGGQNGRIRAVAAAPGGQLWVGTSNKDGRADPGPEDDQLLRVRFA